MRPRTEIAVGLAVLAVLMVGSAALGRRRGLVRDVDPRPSTFLTGPRGARALADAAGRLGISVDRMRRRSVPLPRGGADSLRTLTAYIDPSIPLGPENVTYAAELGRRGRSDLLLAGAGAAPAMHCFGYGIETRRDSAQAYPPSRGPTPRDPWVGGRLARRTDSLVADSAGREDRMPLTCTVPPVRRADTLLVTRGGRAVAIRLALDSADILLIADASLLTNVALRETTAGEFALGLIAGRYDRLTVDEYHHGFGPAGSLGSALAEWSRRSPWGWALWQLSAVAIVALLAGAVRFGPARRVIERRRRSPLEHVRALATALAAARGHDVAIGLLVRGLRRRLARAGEPLRGDPRPWLASLAERVRTPASRTAVATLISLTRGPAGADGVRRAALAVEDVWEDMKP